MPFWLHMHHALLGLVLLVLRQARSVSELCSLGSCREAVFPLALPSLQLTLGSVLPVSPVAVSQARLLLSLSLGLL